MVSLTDQTNYYDKLSNNRRLLNIFLCMSQIGSNAVYILFVAQNIMPVQKIFLFNIFWVSFIPSRLLRHTFHQVGITGWEFSYLLSNKIIFQFKKIEGNNQRYEFLYIRIYIAILLLPVILICRCKSVDCDWSASYIYPSLEKSEDFFAVF